MDKGILFICRSPLIDFHVHVHVYTLYILVGVCTKVPFIAVMRNAWYLLHSAIRKTHERVMQVHGASLI